MQDTCPKRIGEPKRAPVRGGKNAKTKYPAKTNGCPRSCCCQPDSGRLPSAAGIAYTVAGSEKTTCPALNPKLTDALACLPRCFLCRLALSRFPRAKRDEFSRRARFVHHGRAPRLSRQVPSSVANGPVRPLRICMAQTTTGSEQI